MCASRLAQIETTWVTLSEEIYWYIMIKKLYNYQQKAIIHVYSLQLVVSEM